MGLWDLVESGEGHLQRVSTPLVEAYQQLVTGGAQAVGPVRRPELVHV
jgi:hypothetical protein